MLAVSSRSESVARKENPDVGTPEPPSDPPVVELPDDLLEQRVSALAIEFGVDSDASETELPSTRFGGQPDWLEEPLWPMSRSLGTPMEFVAQIALHPDNLAWLSEPKVAYLFVTNDEEDPGGIEIWEPFGGENAVIVQPGGIDPSWIDEFGVSPVGPTVGPEVPIGLSPRRDPELLDFGQLVALRSQDPELADKYYEAIDYDKIGGTPNFFHGFELPDFEEMTITRDPAAATLILMVTNADQSRLSIGDDGRAVAFLSPDQRKAAYLWFC